MTVPTNIGGSNRATAATSRPAGRASVSNIPQPTSKATRSPRSSVTTSGAMTRTLGASSSIPRREEADGSSNPDDPLHKGDNEHDGKVGDTGATSTHQPVIKTRSVSITVTKSRTGQSILPTKTLLPASSNITVCLHSIRSLFPLPKGGMRLDLHVRWPGKSFQF